MSNSVKIYFWRKETSSRVREEVAFRKPQKRLTPGLPHGAEAVCLRFLSAPGLCKIISQWPVLTVPTLELVLIFCEEGNLD